MDKEIDDDDEEAPELVDLSADTSASFENSAAKVIPVTILTGFLGSGEYTISLFFAWNFTTVNWYIANMHEVDICALDCSTIFNPDYVRFDSMNM